MNSERSFQTAFCSEYESLLYECQLAKETCAEWRAQMNSPLSAKNLNREVASELLRLQANYAKAYSLLENHVHECDLCQFVTRMSAASANQVGYDTVPQRVEETWLA